MENPTTLPFDAVMQALPSAATFVWAIFLILAAYTLLHASIFVYHWHAYNIAPRRFLRLTYILYFAGIAFFLFVLFLSAIEIAA